MSDVILIIVLVGLGLILVGIAGQPTARARRIAKLFPENRRTRTKAFQPSLSANHVFLRGFNAKEKATIGLLAPRWQRTPDQALYLFAIGRLLLAIFLTSAVSRLLYLLGSKQISWWLSLLLGVIVASALSVLAIKTLIRSEDNKRRQRIANEIPSAMDLLLISLSSGTALQTALQRVAEELEIVSPDVAGELKEVNADLIVLGDYDQAFERLAERIPMQNIATMTSIIRDSLKTGSPIRSALHTAVEMERRRAVIYVDQISNEVPAKITTVTMALCFPPLLLVIGAPPVVGLINSLTQ